MIKRIAYLFLIVLVLFLSACTKDKPIEDDEKEMVSISLMGSGIENEDIQVEKGSTYTLPTPERVGYVFVGWKNTISEEFVDDSYIYLEDTFLEATWERKTMHIVYYKYGSTTLKEDKFYEGDGYEAYVPTLDGYEFGGWFIDEEFKMPLDLNVSATTIYAFAKFSPKTYTISFDKSDKKITVTYNNRVGVLPKITVSSCAFEGWEYEGKIINATTIYKYTEDITLKAVLKTRSTFDIDGKQTTVNYYVGDAKPYISAIKEGYIFAGWYANSDFSGEAIYTIDSEYYASKVLYAKFVSSDDANNTYANNLVNMVADYYTELYQNKTLYESISLPKDDIYYGCKLSWSSDNRSAIQDNGVITRAKQNQNANLKLTVSFDNVSKEIDLNVVVKADPYKDIVSNKIISAYVYSATFNSRPVDDILLDTVDIINWSFVEPNSDGTIIIPQDYVTKLEKFREAAFNKGVRIIMTVSGTHDDATDLATIASNDEARATFVESIINAIDKYGFAGVDIDWEYPTDNGTKFTTLMTDIYTAIKEYDKDLLVTAAIPAGPFSYSKYGLKKSSEYLDYINMMSYDMGCEQMLHHTALYRSTMTYSGCSVEESVNNFNRNLSVPLDKIIIGAAFYGRITEVTSFNYNSSTGTASGSVNNNGKVGSSVTYQYIYNNYIKSNPNAKVYWDSTAKANYIYDSQAKVFISYESEKSLEEKCKYVNTKGVKGLMWWDYGSDSTGTLITALNSYKSIIKK
ncbi:MAG: InlB B-repeat-containing protein [Bacilli bacterium]|nr:InlB B-repeat-containing protein [Bacilli bacterium]